MILIMANMLTCDTKIEPTPEEMTLLVQNQIIKSGKKPNFTNFLLALKQNKYSILKYFKAAKKHLESNPKISENALLKLLLQLEMADNMLLAGATISEIKNQTKLPAKLLSLLIRKYYNEIPKEVIQIKLMHYRLMTTVKMMTTFYKKVIAEYCPEEKRDFVENFYDTMVDLSSLDKTGMRNLELYSQILGDPE